MSTIADVALRAKVSVATVSHVMNRTRHVEPDTAKRVQEAIVALNYQPNSLARGLRRGVTKTIGLLLPDNSNPFFAGLSRQIENAGFAAGYTVILCNSDGSPEKEQRYLSVLLAKQIDGLIFAGSSDHALAFSGLSKVNIPAVLLDRDIPSVRMDSVLVDHVHGGYLAGRHLIELGHRKIGVITGPDDSGSSPARVRGFTNAVEQEGYKLPEEACVASDYYFTGGSLAMERLLVQAPGITAVFACNDLMAMGAITTLRSRGLRVPDDISIIGFDDIPYAVTTWPPLTTIAQPIEQVGERAVGLLMQRLTKPDEPAKREILLPCLVERDSTAARRR